MSPEQCRGDDVDARSDVYALGLTAFFLWTGRRPYERHALGALLDDQLHAPIPSACALRPELPPSVDEALARLCAKDPADRPATMADVARLLAAMRPRQLHLAPFMTRAFALLLDVVIFGILGAAVEKAYEVLRSYAHLPDLPAFAGEATAALILFASQFGMESRFGGSAGKLLLRLRVVRADGARPSPAALLQRCLLRFPVVAIVWIPDPYAPYGEHAVNGLQMLALLAGALPFLTGRGLSLSDRLTKTSVILAIPGPERDARA